MEAVDILLLVFGAILVAVVLRSPARVVERLAPISGGWALAASVALLAVLVLVGGIYLAVQPDLYRRGLVALVPKPAEKRAGMVLAATGDAFERWLKGQRISMAAVAVMTGVGLWALGVPSAMALGLIAGLAEFVPLIGSIAAAVPALLAASSEGISTTLYVLALFIVVQQVEGNVIMPIIERRRYRCLRLCCCSRSSDWRSCSDRSVSFWRRR